MIKTVLMLLLSATCALAQSSTVNWSGGPGQRDVRLPNGKVPYSGTVAIGYFENDVWYQYGITDIREIFEEPGRFAATASSPDQNFEGNQVVMWISAFSAGGEPYTGIYTSDLKGWTFPAPNALPPQNTLSINSSQVDRALFGSFNDNSLILVPEPGGLIVLAFLGGLLTLTFIGGINGKRRDHQS